MLGTRIYFIGLLFYTLCTICKANQPPQFTKDLNNLILPESTEVGSIVGRLEGSDPEGSEVTYGILGNDIFEVDPKTGDVRLVKQLDREQQETISLIVTIKDRVNLFNDSINDNVVSVPISIIVSDENDVAPEFKNLPYEAVVDEDAPLGFVVTNKILVTDNDTIGDNLELFCIPHAQNMDACFKFSIHITESSQSRLEAEILLNDKLDFNEKTLYQIILLTTDGVFNTTTPFEVQINDVQNKPPIFEPISMVTVSEGSPINSLVLTVSAKDGDRGQPRNIYYDLISNPMDYFLLDHKTGELRTARPLDREQITDETGTVKIRIRAREIMDGVPSDDETATSYMDVSITISDINDTPPTFNQREYFVTISENSPNGTILPVEIHVSDADLGNNSVFSLRLDDLSEVFDVDPKIVTGSSQVSLRIANGNLDYENPNHRKFIVLIIAEELYTSPKLSSTATLQVTLVDVNDNRPMFQKESYFAELIETAEEGDPVITIAATDLDSGYFGVDGLTYSLYGTGSDLFHIDSKTGAITVAKCDVDQRLKRQAYDNHYDKYDIEEEEDYFYTLLNDSMVESKPVDSRLGKAPCLDYETVSTYFLSVTATDLNGTGHASVVSLKISLLDANDSPPVCESNEFRTSIDEGVTVFEPPLYIKARDADSTSMLTYSIPEKGGVVDKFGVDKLSGLVFLNSPLAFSDGSHVLFHVDVNDGHFTTSCKVRVNLNKNNHPPTFYEDVYYKTIEEILPIGSTVIMMNATDVDEGPNAELSYRIESGSFDDFVIDKTSGVVKVNRQLNFDNRNHYRIHIVVSDHGTTELSGSTLLVVNVTDQNNKHPYFTPITQKVELTEDVEPGTEVYRLKAKDDDIESEELLEFSYQEPVILVDKSGSETHDAKLFTDTFDFQPNGRIILKRPIKRDYFAVVRLQIVVTDPTAPSLQQGFGILLISVIQSNSEPPIFEPPWTPDSPKYTFDLLEEPQLGFELTSIVAEDKDSSIAYYELDPNDYFEINKTSGAITVKSRIDYDNGIKMILLTVTAYDTGVPQLSSKATVVINVLNVNDNKPVFKLDNYNFSVQENAEVGTIVGSVLAVDMDEGQYGQIEYSLTGDDNSVFGINSKTGEISVKNSDSLDREKTSSISITAVASDMAPMTERISTAVPVLITLQDTNDNPPVFEQKLYEVWVAENIQLNPPATILQVKAHDNDSSDVERLRYVIKAGDSELFRVDANTGIIYPVKNFDGLAGSYSLEIEVTDNLGKGPHSDLTEVRIQVHAINMHKPVFVVPSINNETVNIARKEAVKDYVVSNVLAEDDDENENGRVTYSFKVNNEDTLETDEFVIDEVSGQISIKEDLLDKETELYELVLAAKDHGTPAPYETLRFLSIIITDDAEPIFEFTNSLYKFYIDENLPPGSKVGQVQIELNKKTKTTQAHYFIISGNDKNHFYIDKTNGEIITNVELDREKIDKYELIVSTGANLNKSNLESANGKNNTTKVLIFVNDINDCAPYFEQKVYFVGTSYKNGLDELVTVVQANDSDLGENATLDLSIRATYLKKYGAKNITIGSIVPSPFTITREGRVLTASYMAEYNQDYFILEIVAQELAEPRRQASAEIKIWVYEPNQLVRIVISKPPNEVYSKQLEIAQGLSEAAKKQIVIDDVKYHVEKGGKVRLEWSDVYIHAVDPSTNSIVPVEDILKVIDSQYEVLKEFYTDHNVESVIPAYSVEATEEFDIALAGIIALLVVLFFGSVSVMVLCCCLKHWIVSVPPNVRRKDALIKKQIIEDLNTTENPLWMEQKLKLYEEQELTMQVFLEPEGLQYSADDSNSTDRRNSFDTSHTGDNTYATIQPRSHHPHNSTNTDLYTVSNLPESTYEFRSSSFQTFQDR